MILYRESDNSHFLFNGEWPIGITPNGNSWAADKTDLIDQQIKLTELDISKLNAVLQKPEQSTFLLNKTKYIVTYRSKFIDKKQLVLKN
jgi:hypothetical protein